MKYLLLPLHLFLTIALAAQGMEFEHGPWAEALAKAKSTGKPIFMDAFTTWCGPCKMMSNQTFKDEAVGKFYNASFINVKMDMEHGEGIELAKTYAVNLYPTLLFIDGEGNILHRTAGFHAPEAFLELGKTALAPEKRLVNLEKKFAAGDRNPDLLFALTKARGDAYAPNAGEAADEYLKTQTDLGSERNMEVIMAYVNDPHAAGFQYFIKNKKAFETKYSTQAVAQKVEQSFHEYLDKHPEMGQAEVENLFTAVYPEEGARLASAYRMSAAREKGDRDGFATAAVEHFKKYPSHDPEELNEVAWTFFRVVEDEKLLKKAVKWAKKSVKLNPSFYNHDTLASLYYKLKKKKCALKNAQKAIELAKAAGEDYGQSQELLDKIYKL